MERMARLRLFTLFSVVVQEPQPSAGTGRLCPACAESDPARRRDTGLVNIQQKQFLGQLNDVFACFFVKSGIYHRQVASSGTLSQSPSEDPKILSRQKQGSPS